MTANEIRIGNRLLHKVSNKEAIIVEVRSIGLTGINLYGGHYGDADPEFYYSELAPVSLSISILEKCGFKEEKDNNFWHCSDTYTFFYVKGMWISRHKQSGEFFLYNVSEDDFYSSNFPQIEHLHRLQNLYYSLTREDLIINL